MSQNVYKDILAKRRDRMIAVILGVKESQCDKYLPAEASQALRKIVLDQINDYYDLAFDILKSLDSDTVVINEEYAKKLDDIHEVITNATS